VGLGFFVTQQTRLGRRGIFGGLAVWVAALALGACTTDRFGAGPQVGAGVPVETARVAGGDAPKTGEHRKLVASFGGEYRSPAAEQVLSDVMTRVAKASGDPDRTYRVTILNSPIVNAFALPSGDLFVTRGLLALANDTSEIAAVMAHEIAHVSARHAVQRAELERRSAIVSRVVAEVLEDPLAGEAVQARSRYSIASFSRAQELEADQIGVRTTARAGFDPYGAARFLASLGRQSAMRASLMGERGPQPASFLSSHPSTPERVSKALATARELGAPGLGEGDRNRYLTAIDGMTFGDDPAEGVVRGRRFLHPTLGITFVAPEGFWLENSAVAVVGVGADGAQALRFDSVKLPGGASLESYLTSGWIDGVQISAIEPIDIGGLPGATATAKGDEWTFRLAAVRVGTATYRFIIAARQLTPEVDRKFLETIRSFKLLSPEEAAGVRPLRIVLVEAKPGDTLDSMVAKMSTADRSAERFAVLNGLDRNAAIKPGQRYKIVAD
jgi:predicted Zn-dependent protease